MSALVDITGQRFGKLVVMERRGSSSHGETLFLCQCDCGSQKIISAHEMRRGRTKSCGCLRASIRTGVTKSPLFRVLSIMKQRCHNPKNPGYPHYGGRGIYVCKEWDDAAAFIKWANENGYKPGLEVDRIDNDGPYSPENCRFVTRKVNTRNTRRNRYFTWNGRKVTVSEIAEKTGIHYNTIRWRLVQMEMTVEDAVKLPRDTWKTRRLLSR